MLCNDCESFFKQKWNRAPFLKDYHGHFHNNFLRTENEVASCELCRYLSESSLSTQLKDDSAHLEYGFFARGPHEIEHQLFIGIGSKNHIGRRGLDFTLMGESGMYLARHALRRIKELLAYSFANSYSQTSKYTISCAVI